MIGTRRRQSWSLALCVAVVLATVQLESGATGLLQMVPGTADYTGQGTPLNDEQLQALLAPIALYPDTLIAQVLAAATFPDQLAAAYVWTQQNKNLAGTALMEAVNNQPWDPSVKAMTEFPAVLANMVQNLAWTSQLGDTFHNEQPEVMTAIQSLRAKAKGAGNLKSTAQMTVIQQSPDVIVIRSNNPGVIYVPNYNPALVYGVALKTSGYSPPETITNAEISFPAGVAVAALSSASCCDWMWSNWSLDWFHGGAIFHSYPYYGNNAWSGGHYGGYYYYGYHTYYNGYDYNHPYDAYQSVALRPGDAAVTHTAGANPAHIIHDASWNKASGGWTNTEDLRGWGPPDSRSDNPTAFSSWSSLSASSTFGGGWGDRSASYRGWTSHGPGGGWGNAPFTGYKR